MKKIQQVNRYLRFLKYKIYLNIIIKSLITGFLYGVIGGVLIAIASIFISIPYLSRLIMFFYLGSVIVSLIIGVIKKPNIKTVFKIADSLGLKERLTTFLEFENDNSAMAKLQREDTLRIVTTSFIQRKYGYYIPKKRLFISLILIFCTIGILFIPFDKQIFAKDLETFFEEKNIELKKIEQVKDGIVKNSKMTREAKLNLDEEIKKLIKNNKTNFDKDKMIKEISRTIHKIETMKFGIHEKSLEQLSKSLEDNTLSKELSSAVKSKDKSQISEAMKNINNQLENLSEEEKQKLLKKLKEQNDLSTEFEAEKMLEEIMDSLESNDSNIDNNSQAYNKMSNALKSSKSNLMGVNSNLTSEDFFAKNSNTNQNTSNSAESLGQDTGVEGDEYVQGTPNQPSGISGTGSVNQPGEGMGTGISAGSGSGKGIGNGMGQGAGGNGAGDGSSNSEDQYSQEMIGGFGGKKSGGESIVENFESIYTPQRVGGNKDESYVNGQMLESGTIELSETNSGQMLPGEFVPYNKVLLEYKDKALTNIDSPQIPSVMKDIVKEYFSSLD